MALSVSYPGVYIQEIPSGVRTITGVPTAIAAFVGRAARGPVNEAVTITSYADYERMFGGLAEFSNMSFAVRDYFLNGGSRAVIVRLFRNRTGGGVPPASTPIDVGALVFEAANQGTWGRGLRVRIDTNVPAGMGATMGVAQNTLFNLRVTDVNSGQSETFQNLTSVAHASRVDTVLAQRSALLRWRGAYPNAAPAVAAGADAVSVAEDAVEAARRAVPFNQGNFNTAVTNLNTALAAQGGDNGDTLRVQEFFPNNARTNKTAFYSLEQADLFTMLCIPPTDAATLDPQIVGLAASYCEERRAFMIVDPPDAWNTPQAVVTGMAATPDPVGTRSRNSMISWPRLRMPNPFHNNDLETFVACGAVAGVLARTDGERGVWKAAAGLEATLRGVPDLMYNMTDGENGLLNPIGVNALRIKNPAGRIVYGARTLVGDDRLASEWKYVPVRRLALYIEESLFRGTQWAVFEPNDEPLWAQIRLNLGAFMNNLFRKGAFQGQTPSEAYFVKCDSETTTQNDINLGVVNIVVGFAPLKPAEFVVISLQQMAGRVQA
ncbi:MAG: phage tail sheath subtilisin-like domain-containing protein [Fimbriimonadaceae bacterium]|nr:phage tail sheath subtilisin-like domain-containing protein [Fimbriimonadaceae bacterium]